GDRYGNVPEPWMRLSRNDVARVRVLDSLAIPQLGHLSPERVMNLCFPDGKLRDLHERSEMDLSNERDGLDFAALRRMNRSSLVQVERADCSWSSLVRDLTRIIAATGPTLVVTPHPKLDPPFDHLFAT